MSVTIKDVARVSGFSISTVSKVINNSPRISQSTINKVNETIKSLNYVPNKSARDLSTKYTKRIAFISKIKRNISFINPHIFEVMMGAQKTINQYGYTLEFHGVVSKKLDLIKKIIEEKSSDGLLIHASVLDSETANYLVKSRFPHTVIGTPPFPNGVCWIDINNAYSGELAVRHLIDIERDNMCFIGGTKTDAVSNLRLQGVQQELEHHHNKLSENQIFYTTSTQRSSYLVTMEILKQTPMVNSIICANNMIALGCMKALNDSRISIPEQVAVITFDDYPYATITSPPTTSINIDVFDLGSQAAKLLIEKIKNPQYRFQTYSTTPLVVIRESTRIE